MTVLLTGGAGFIGQHTAARLVAAGYDVIAVDILNPQVHDDTAASRAAFPGDVITADIAEPSAWTSLPEVDTVIHLAAETGVGQSMYARDRYHRVNVGGTQLAARFAARNGIPLISLSSRAVYGEGHYECPDHGTTFGDECCAAALPVPSREDDDRVPVSVYGETKVLGEDAATRALGSSGRLTLVRPQNVVGPGQALHNPYTGVLAAFLAMLREGKPIAVYGDGTDTRDFVHVADLADLLTWLVDNPPSPGAPRVVNAGTGTRTSLTELAAAAGDAAPVAQYTVTHLDVHRAGDIRHACADLDRLTSLGAPLPRFTSATAIGDFIRESWRKPGAPTAAWAQALDELNTRGLTS